MLAHTWQRLLHRTQSASYSPRADGAGPSQVSEQPALEFAADDPLLVYLSQRSIAMDIDSIGIQSPALSALRKAGMRLVIPLVSQGELTGLLSLGPRLSDQHYSGDDKRLLEILATQAAPVLRVAQLMRQQHAQAQARARIEQELQVARTIQQFFLPHTLPDIAGWQLGAHYQPAHAVGGDFYDFIQLDEGRLGLVIGDVADKGVPAALVMAATRGILRASAQRLVEPAAVLRRVNEVMVPDTPPHIFVTCLYAVLDVRSGRLRYANAGHAPPFIRTCDGDIIPLQARGVPLGIMQDSVYEAHETQLSAEDHVLFYSDGLVEAHNRQREMFGFDRLEQFLAEHGGASSELISALLADLAGFVGPAWDQEDDVTLVTLKRLTDPSQQERWQTLAELSVVRQFGNERLAIARIVEAIGGMGLDGDRLEGLKTALAEAIVNAIEHADAQQPDVPVSIQVRACMTAVSIAISNVDGDHSAPMEPEQPDLLAKLEGRQQPRGWGQFLMRRLADEVIVSRADGRYTVELRFARPC